MVNLTLVELILFKHGYCFWGGPFNYDLDCVSFDKKNNTTTIMMIIPTRPAIIPIITEFVEFGTSSKETGKENSLAWKYSYTDKIWKAVWAINWFSNVV